MTRDIMDHLPKNEVLKHYKKENYLDFNNSSAEQIFLFNGVDKPLHCPIDFLSIKTLNLSNNNLEQAPDKLCELKNLEFLNLSSNNLTDLPFSYSKLQRLQELNISSNKFDSIPKCISHGMGTLKILNVSKNPSIKMNVIPYSKYLEKFDGSDNKKCKKFPDWLLSSKFFYMKEFNLDRTVFEMYFVGLDRELSVKSITMSCSNLSDPVLNMFLENTANLEKINVGNENLSKEGNLFSCIPIDQLTNPAFITELNFSSTDLAFVPKTINKLCNLKILELRKNSISWFPDEFCELKELEYLNIEENDFLLFPQNFGNLKSLKELRAKSNCVTTIPDSFKNLSNLKYLDLYDNLIKDFPKHLFQMPNLKELDLEMNYFLTNDETDIESYTTLRKNLISLIDKSIDLNPRLNGAKEEPKIESTDSEKSYYCISGEDDKLESNDMIKIESNVNDENWDVSSESDDDFEPENPKTIYFLPKSRNFIQPTPMGFCPADMHQMKVKCDVSSMRAYGSLPSFKVVEGQFDDA